MDDTKLIATMVLIWCVACSGGKQDAMERRSSAAIPESVTRSDGTGSVVSTDDHNDDDDHHGSDTVDVNDVMVKSADDAVSDAANAPATVQNSDDVDRSEMPPRMRCLVEAYPTHLCGGDATHVHWCDGTKMLWDDGIAKTDHDTLLNTADLEDHMSQPYAPGRDYGIPIPVNHEPGRIRHTPLFLKMYGETESKMRKTLTRITWLPNHDNRRIRVTTVNDVHKKFEAVSRDIEQLSPSLIKAVAKSTGPFYWRTIKGTKRMSMHSFAIAFDIGMDHAYYWRWSKKANGLFEYKNKMPMEVVEIFEKHGFIWGGKWYHFDTPHFEYRPELLHPACVATRPRA